MQVEKQKAEVDLGIGYVYIQQLRKGITDLESVATAFQSKRKEMENGAGFCYDRFTKDGSSSEGVVIDEKGQNQEKIIWCVNHYLGLNRHPKVMEAAVEATLHYGTGAGTSGLSGGRCELHYAIENHLSSLLNKEAVLLYSTGYTANLGCISAIAQKNDVIISDQENHISIKDGIKLSKAKKLFFNHNDVRDLEEKLKSVQGKDGNTFVIVESAYSMSGNLSPLKAIVGLKKKYGFYLYLDEAHSLGFYGDKGAGYAQSLGVLDEVDFFAATFSKSCASIGGFIALKEKFRTFLMCRSSAQHQACFAPSNAATILASIKLFSEDDRYAKDLHAKNAYMRSKLTQMGFDLGISQSPIIPIFISDVELLNELERDLFQNGIFAVAVIYPAVSALEGRIRLIMNTSHSYQQIDRTLNVLEMLGRKYGVI